MDDKILTASGKSHSQFQNYVDVSKLEYNDLDFLELCMDHIISIECMKITKTNYIESLIEVGADVGYQMVISGNIKLVPSVSKENFRKRYIDALSNMLDYIDSKEVNRFIHNDELNEAYKTHLNHKGKGYDNSSFYDDIILLASLTDLFKDRYKKEFSFIASNRYNVALKNLHKTFYTLFIRSKFIKEDTTIIINPLSGIADFIEYEDKRNFDFSILIDNTLYMILVDSSNELNTDKWRNLKLKYKALVIEKATESRNRYLDLKLVNKIAVYRAVNAEIEVILDLGKLKREAYNFYMTKDIVELLKGIEEPILSEGEFFKRLEN